MMGGAKGSHPGRVVEFDKNLRLVAEHPSEPPDQGFNPHGVSVRPEADLMVTSDFICPTSILHAVAGDLDLRGSIRVWSFAQRKILRTVEIPRAGGTIDIRLIPGDAARRAFTAGMLDDKLYLVDTAKGAASPVFDFATIAKGGWPQRMRTTSDGKRLFVSMNMAGKVAMFDTSHAETPRVVAVLDLGQGSGPHYIALTSRPTKGVLEAWGWSSCGYSRPDAPDPSASADDDVSVRGLPRRRPGTRSGGDGRLGRGERGRGSES
jgi:hypothetical protein